jgi:hypothetical protein
METRHTADGANELFHNIQVSGCVCGFVFSVLVYCRIRLGSVHDLLCGPKKLGMGVRFGWFVSLSFVQLLQACMVLFADPSCCIFCFAEPHHQDTAGCPAGYDQRQALL